MTGAWLLAAILAGCGAGSAQPSVPPPASGAAISAAKPASSAAGSSQAAAALGQADWDSVLVKAKQEGKVSVLINPPAGVYQPLYDAFQKKYGIATELVAFGGSADLVPRLKAERDAGQYSWDAAVHAPSTLFAGAKPLKALDPLKPALMLPEVLDDSKWFHGFDAGWYDSDKSLAYSFVGYVFWGTYINRQLLPESQLSRVDQLWDPQWKGKIAIQDPRVASAGSAATADWLVAKGEDKLRAMFQNQQLVITQDKRQLAQWVVQGQYPIAVGLSESQMSEFKANGLPIDQVQPLTDSDRGAAVFSSASGSVGLINRAPHPNAARVFINWLLTPEGQQLYSQLSGFNSRRLDVPVVSPQQTPDPARDYVNVETEQAFPNYAKAINIAKEVLK
ncbi:MAG TPA: extracellular solute-binding protein [Chloroflexota bacterium]|nr:extracellular solute-binding protein [Chloroflexota bacterium]